MPSSARTNPDAKLNFDPLPAPLPPMPTLQRPMIMPRVLGFQQQSNFGFQQSLTPRIIRPQRAAANRRSQSQTVPQQNLLNTEDINVVD